jgi:hypothetical protein
MQVRGQDDAYICLRFVINRYRSRCAFRSACALWDYRNKKGSATMTTTLSKDSALTLPDAARSAMRWFALPVAALIIAFAAPAKAQTYMNMSIGGAFAPGVYGQIAIGDRLPPPPLINLQPVIVGRPIHGAPVMYLHVSPDEYRHWGRYCARYKACGRPVNFVRIDQRNRWWEHGHDGGNRYDRPAAYRQREQGDKRRDERDGNRKENRDENRR